MLIYLNHLLIKKNNNNNFYFKGCCHRKPLLVPGGRAFVWPGIQYVQRLAAELWALSGFLSFFNNKKWFFASSIKLIWLGVGFLNGTGAEIGYQLYNKCNQIIFYYRKNSKIPQVPSSAYYFNSFIPFGTKHYRYCILKAMFYLQIEILLFHVTYTLISCPQFIGINLFSLVY